ncbi:MurR/RpiR family transcriptional regulator [Salinispira pacifica]
MLSIDETRLNAAERATLESLAGYAENNPPPTIVEAAAVCSCSVSHVSKSVRKAGFPGYKRYIGYLYHREETAHRPVDEIERLMHFLTEFDPTVVRDFVELIRAHERIILFGYGPSQICAQYAEYKLRLCMDASVATAPDEQSVESMAGRGSLLVILTATGRYRRFDAVTQSAVARRAEVVIVSQEFNPALTELGVRCIFLSHQSQPDTLKPYEKSRAVLFIFFEEVVRRMLEERNEGRP